MMAIRTAVSHRARVIQPLGRTAFGVCLVLVGANQADLQRDLSLDLAQTGLLGSVLAGGLGVGIVAGGPLFDRYPRRPLFVGCMLIAGAALWVAPYLYFESMRPADAGFDPNQWGASFAALVLIVRGVGYGLVTPFMEELFVRSWLIRYVDVYDKPDDFRDVPIGRFRWPSFLVVVFYFTFSHVSWEWPVAVVWIVVAAASVVASR